jgi:hypothetical protein
MKISSLKNTEMLISHKSYHTHLLLVYRVMLTVVTTVIATNQFLKDCVYLKPPPKPSYERYTSI